MGALKNSRRYKTLKFLLEKNEIESFPHFFEIIPPTAFAIDMGINYQRLGNKALNPEKFLVKDIRKMAELIDVDPKVIFSFISGLIDRKRIRLELNHKNNNGEGLSAFIVEPDSAFA